MGLMADIGRRWRIGSASRTAAPRADIGGQSLPVAVMEMLRGGTSADRALTLSSVHRSVSLISGAVGSMPVQVRRRVGDTRREVQDHWVVPLLRRRPNKWQTPQQFKRMMQAQLLLRGNAYALKVGTARGGYSQLIPLNPDQVTVRQLDDFALEYDWISKSGQRRVLPQSDVLHLVGLTLDGVTGISVLRSAADTIGYAIDQRRHGRAVFANSTRLGGVLGHPKNIGLEAQENLRASMDAFRGPENAGRSLILEEGMTWTPMAMTMEDAQFVETAGLSRLEIYQFFGLPPHMAGDTEKATSWGTGIEAMSQGFVTYTLNDWLVTWEETLARDLLQYEPDMYIQFNRNSLLRGDVKTRWAAYGAARQWAVMTPNEVRGLEDMGPLDGLDDPFVGGNGQRVNDAATVAEEDQ